MDETRALSIRLTVHLDISIIGRKEYRLKLVSPPDLVCPSQQHLPSKLTVGACSITLKIMLKAMAINDITYLNYIGLTDRVEPQATFIPLL